MSGPASESPAAPRLVLASASPARLGLLRAAGFVPEVIVSGVDESTVTAESPRALTLELARMKALAACGSIATAALEPLGVLVVGCDSVLELDGQVYGKPADEAEALRRWALMAGRSGVLHTGHCIVDAATGKQAADVASTVVRFGTPEPEELAAYVASGEPLRVAGAFTLDGLSAPFIDGIDGDPGNVIGLSLPLLRRLLVELGVRITDLWVHPAENPA